ncbi:unnamed protein product [Leptosia nina]|uniref:Serpin domain-containing protein n=1 Tax=Leptosia nina TaxID=320188 RepID=A0AAV1JGA9_9NEOP
MKTGAAVVCLIAFVHAQDLSVKVNNFGLELLYFAHQDTRDNTVISPFGVWSQMVVLALGATKESRNQLDHALRLPKNNTKVVNAYHNLTTAVLHPIIHKRSFMFYDMRVNISKKYEMISEYFGSMPIQLDFKQSNSAALVANRLLIDSGVKVSNVLIPSDFDNTTVILTCVIKFRGSLRASFSSKNTKLAAFYDDKNGVNAVFMMRQIGKFLYSNLESIRSQVLEMPYNAKYSLVLILPHIGTTLNDVYHRFELISLDDILNSLVERKVVEVELPRFKISTNLILNEPLNLMGVDIFEKEYASFDNIAPEFCISKFVHKVVFEISESSEDDTRTATDYDAKFTANRPFVYLVIEKTTQTIVLNGVYSRPSGVLRE